MADINSNPSRQLKNSVCDNGAAPNVDKGFRGKILLSGGQDFDGNKVKAAKPSTNVAVTSEAELIRRRLLIDADGSGEDKKLAKLSEVYFVLLNEEDAERIHSWSYYETFKSLMELTSGIQCNVERTYHAINTNTKASAYWELANQCMKKEMTELKAIVLAMRQKANDLKRNKKECQEREALVKLVNQSMDRKVLEEKLADLREEHEQLQARHTELEEKIASKKVYLGYLGDIIKRLASEDLDGIGEAIVEIEEKVLSDVSMDLE